jgi:hypothetical protein
MRRHHLPPSVVSLNTYKSNITQCPSYQNILEITCSGSGLKLLAGRDLGTVRMREWKDHGFPPNLQ